MTGRIGSTCLVCMPAATTDVWWLALNQACWQAGLEEVPQEDESVRSGDVVGGVDWSGRYEVRETHNI